MNVIDTPGFLSDDTAEYAKNADIAIIPVQPGTLEEDKSVSDIARELFDEYLAENGF